MELKPRIYEEIPDKIDTSNHPIVELKHRIQRCGVVTIRPSNHPIVELKLDNVEILGEGWILPIIP